jgi:hypothetical protein
MPLSQFSVTAPLGGTVATGSIILENGILESVTAIAESAFLQDLPVYVHLFLAAGDTNFTSIAAALASGYTNVLTPIAWTGQIHLFGGCRLVARCQSRTAQLIRIAALTTPQ